MDTRDIQSIDKKGPILGLHHGPYLRPYTGSTSFGLAGNIFRSSQVLWELFLLFQCTCRVTLPVVPQAALKASESLESLDTAGA